MTAPRKRIRAASSPGSLGLLFDWFAENNNIAKRSESSFGYIKNNKHADCFGRYSKYLLPMDGAKLVCLRHDFNDADSGIYYEFNNLLDSVFSSSFISEEDFLERVLKTPGVVFGVPDMSRR